MKTSRSSITTFLASLTPLSVSSPEILGSLHSLMSTLVAWEETGLWVG